MNARLERVCLRGTLLAALIGSSACFGGGGTPGDDTSDPKCQIQTEGEKSPGYPYNLDTFKTDIVPLLVSGCTAGTCHLPDAPASGVNKNFTVWSTAADSECDRVQTFNSFQKEADTTNVANSRIIYALTGGLTTHPVKVTDQTYQQADLDKLQAFITDANATCVADNGCSPSVVEYFDFKTFQDVIQPGLDNAGSGGAAGVGCSSGAQCHAPPTGQLGVVLNPAPAPDSAEMKANYEIAKSKINLDGDPKSALFYIQATNAHSPGNLSTQVDSATATAMLGWIQAAVDAKAKAGNPTGPSTGCANPAVLNIGVFQDEILPLLNGDVDYNNQNDQGVSTGCTRGPCHGQQRAGGMSLIATDPVETQLANFACFVDLTSPSSSQVLLCPTKDPRCIKAPHPGDRIFDGADDANYQRILSFLFSANTDNVPTDLGFFARRINPIFDNVNAVEDGAQNRSCNDAQSCHGIAVAGNPPPNFSNFGLLQNAGENINTLKANFVEASSFINFSQPNQSSLFLYPTNEIANEDNQFATGVDHPGGEDFAVDSQFAVDIQKFAAGLSPNGNGEQLNWLVAGDFQGTDNVDDEVAIAEDTITPGIFDRSGGGLLAGKWDAVFQDVAPVDISAFIGGQVGAGRTTFAVSYLVNVSSFEQEVEVELTTNNDALLFVGTGIAQVNAGQTGSLTIRVPPSRATDTPINNRLMVKSFEDPADGGINFTVRLLRADNNVAFNDVGRELVVKTANAAGGI